MKIKEFWTKNKKTVLRGLAAAGIIVAVSVAIFLVLLAFKVVYFDDGMKLNAALVESFRSSAWGNYRIYPCRSRTYRRFMRDSGY